MITNVADLLRELRAKEVIALEKYAILRHQGMIGDMYEGLTREILRRSCFEDVDLRVVTGKVRLRDGSLSRQMDAMVVLGSGEPIPYTEHLLYPIKQVVAVVEVKKTLYGAELTDSYTNLESIRSKGVLTEIPRAAFMSSFQMLAQTKIPVSGDLEELPLPLEMMAYNLAWDAALPIRIVFGYDGYQTEHTLREGLVAHLERAANGGPRHGFGPSNLPNLIVCGENALVKLNAMPFAANTSIRDAWMVYGSLPSNNMALLLEVLWCRLLHRGLVTYDVFGEDLQLEGIRPLLSARFTAAADTQGWAYTAHHLDAPELATMPSMSEWAPVVLSELEANLVAHLCNVGSLNTAHDAHWQRYCVDMDEGLEWSLEYLRYHGLVALDYSGHVHLLAHECRVAFLPEIGWLAAENESGRLQRWLIARAEAKPGRAPEALL